MFIISSAFNDGLTRFTPAIPFYFILAYFVNKLKLSTKLKLSFLSIVIASILLNVNLTQSTFFYPITGGQITFKQDGFIIRYSDNSARFLLSTKEAMGEFKIYEVSQGQSLEVERVQIHYPDLSKRYSLVTEKGNLSIPSPNEVFELSRPVSSVFLELGNLMYYPIFPILLMAAIKSPINS